MLFMFNRDQFESLRSRIFSPQKSENVRPHSSIFIFIMVNPVVKMRLQGSSPPPRPIE